MHFQAVAKANSFNLPLRRRSRKLFTRCLSFGAVVVTLYIELCGSFALKRTLWGRNYSNLQTISYRSSTISNFIDLRAEAAQASPIVFLHSDPYSEQTNGCTIDAYGIVQSQLDVVARILRQSKASRGIPSFFAPATLVVDCSFTGLVDGSILRVHVADAERSQLVTYTIQTLRALRPTIHQDEACVLVATVWTNLTALRRNPTSYRHATAPLYSLRLGSTSRLDENVDVMEARPVAWTLRTSNGTVDVLGIQGVFFGDGAQGPSELLGHTIQFMWAQPATTTALDYLTAMDVMHQTTISHTYAWIQALIVVGVWGRLLVNLIVTGVVVVSRYKATGKVALPQVFPAVQRTLASRAWLIMLAMMCDQFWGLRILAVRHGYTRLYLWPAMDDPTLRANLLTWFMALASWVARHFDLSLSPMVVLAIFCLCEHFQSAFLLPLPAVDRHLAKMYNQNQLESAPGFLPTRSYGSLRGMPWWFVMYDLSWLIVACMVLIVYVAIVLAATRADARHHSRRMKRRSAVSPFGFLQSVTHVRLMHSNITAPFRRVFLAPHQGLVEPVDDIVCTSDSKLLLLNGSSLWCAGWVRLNVDYLVRVEAIPALLFNLLCQTTFFSVCGAKLDHDRLTHFDCLCVNELNWRDFLTLSITHVKLPRRFKGLSLHEDFSVIRQASHNAKPKPHLAKDDSDRKSTHVGSSRGPSVFEAFG
ncbi:hypothetical protein, variant 1 [Aphanomyces invadans]|nr:hypothetical protein, variant 1 [Aphanomyces invadans]ETV99487.1 hypothetical protein, variant 1 [Aphanomyces invadans]|eukprot:XP_008872043.1 hypothetical protein, variant 1 [Aphanomyces invadans]